ncbi:AraC family transcriptional regulator [Clostridium sp. D2Q-14]|uniref:AraC family transcriptional regulator n=1 Tax=Anaeromonas gelatinilytica TaxID=2683194 RepID=UPI00193C0D09|nr:helix-turn-helix domain-containing protein [Anaeromonas gelatinilytica]MBS4535221.1 AraC family transcriptional regulator [Anaeromonas gelatinilytica]
MHAWEAIQKSVDYIEEHLQEDISSETLAEMVGLSPFYFQRLFKRLVKKPVQEYIKLRRLSKVILELGTDEQRILDIALDYGFSSHANFTRAFKKTYGITPEEYKKSHPRLNTFAKPEVSMNYITIDENVPLIVGNIVLEVQRKQLYSKEVYLGFASEVNIADQVPVGESTGIDVPGQLWNNFHARKEKIADLIDPDIELGMSHMANSEKGTFTYFAGSFAKSPNVEIRDPFIKQELPAGEYIVCSIEAETFEELVTTALDQANKYLFGTWLKNHSLVTQSFSAEKYYKGKANENYMEIWVIPIPVDSL